MKDKDDHKLSDDELADYLAGRDAASASYRLLDQETPPPALDARILARARESVENSKPDFSRDVFIRPYATAATVLVCLGITFLLVNQPDMPSPADTGIQAERLQRAAEPQQQVAESASELDAIAEQAQAPTEAPARQRQELTNATASTAAAPALNANQELRLADAAADTVVQDFAAGAAVSAELEEIVVSAAQLAPADFRNDREAWLQEIARLRETGDTGAAETEANLFLARYPDADLEAELAALANP